jgi:CRISPR-associated protein Cas2
MRSSYIVSYDISEPRRLKKVHKAMVGFGQHIQYSVFRCDFSDVDKVRMKARIGALINHKEDQVLIIDLGPTDGRARNCIEHMGKPYYPRAFEATVV